MSVSNCQFQIYIRGGGGGGGGFQTHQFSISAVYQARIKVYAQRFMAAVGYLRLKESENSQYWQGIPYRQHLFRHAVYIYTNSVAEYI